MQLKTLAVSLSAKPATTRGVSLAEETNDGVSVRAGEPVHVRWRTLYSGDLPNKFLRKKKNKTVVLSSFVKSGAGMEGAPRVVNAVYDKLADFDDETPSAKSAGSHVVHYSSAVGSDLIVEIELVSKSSDGKDMDKLRRGLEFASSTPLLFFASGWINSVGGIVKVADGLIKALKRDKLLFSAPLLLSCSQTQPKITTPQAYLAAKDPFSLFEGRSIEKVPKEVGGYPRLKNADGTWYKGPEPYVIFEVDQNERPDLKDFESQVRAGALLKDWTPKEGVDVGEVMEVMGKIKVR